MGMFLNSTAPYAALRFKGKLGEKPKYTGHIIAAGISYCRTAKNIIEKSRF